MRLKFKKAFDTSPEFVPTWRLTGEKWDRGALCEHAYSAPPRFSLKALSHSLHSRLADEGEFYVYL